VFGSVVASTFQITFRAEMYANDFFYFLKIIFDISTSKRSKKYKPYSILTKKKKFKFERNASTNTLPNVPFEVLDQDLVLGIEFHGILRKSLGRATTCFLKYFFICIKIYF
jgi:hypothetical protein